MALAFGYGWMGPKDDRLGAPRSGLLREGRSGVVNVPRGTVDRDGAMSPAGLAFASWRAANRITYENRRSGSRRPGERFRIDRAAWKFFRASPLATAARARGGW
jgi:hypothetical protein